MELNEQLDAQEDSPQGKSPEDLLIDRESAEGLQERMEALLSPMEKSILQAYLNGDNYIRIAERMGKVPNLWIMPCSGSGGS